MTIHIDSDGRGDDLVLIHGWGIHGGVWQSVAERLAEDYCVHRVDLPGCGHSPMVEPYTLAALAAELAAAFPLPVHVLGWSLGGAVGVEWALSQPEQVRSLTLCASSPCFMERPDWPHGTPPTVLGQFASSLADDYAATLEMFLGLQVMGSRDGRAVLRALQGHLEARPAPSRAALFEGLAILRQTDLRPRMAGLVCPLLLQYGDRDRMTPPAAGHWLAEVTGAQLVLHQGAGHAPFISHQQAFIETQREFLARC
ncbi:pimeloyl-ACP methyl ester esterase BioH [Chitinimonas lacunae]|uniref:Pimeloyl-[acyl-carrier protein] methyl ester esterase n=1 Tax=Chitinimonas lacunae TaxID=1963018 RepID=A0ABV8MSE5_9NEIS